MSEIEAFKAEVERFIETHNLNPTQFGKTFAGDPLFVFQLRDGREPRTATRQKISAAMSEFEKGAAA
ncbi:hypothetical protein [Oricola sp.]|uniref:hypothetical protein n=1 Tax=Oricola sp. TaxID=1979950 RepID=UPI0025E62CA0|nr:hypothetical protein [Oricola sp.]MCI5073420.1 hypothetical protein [Oricola sp.]